MNFLDELDNLGEARSDREAIFREFHLISEYTSLGVVRVFILAVLFVLIILEVIYSSHYPKAEYCILLYFFFSFVADLKTKKTKTQPFLLETLRIRYHFTYGSLLTRLISTLAMLPVLVLLQYVYLAKESFTNDYLAFYPLLTVVCSLILFACIYLLSYVRLKKHLHY